MSKVQIVGIDLGNFNVKTSNKEIFKATYETKIDKGAEFLSKTGGGNSLKTLEYNSVTYYIDRGDFDTHSTKSSKDTLPLFLYALSKVVKKTTKDVKVVLGLPLHQLDDKDIVIKKFKGTFTFKADGTIRTINVLDVRVFPECVGANYSIPDTVPLDYILMDFGGLSTNKVLFQDSEYVMSSAEPIGILNLVDEVADLINQDHRTKLNTAKAYNVIMKDSLFIPSLGNISVKKYVDKVFSPYVKSVLDSLESLDGLNTPIYVIGGASSLFKPYIMEYLKQNEGRYYITFLDDAIFYNALGFLEVGKLTWND